MKKLIKNVFVAAIVTLALVGAFYVTKLNSKAASQDAGQTAQISSEVVLTGN